MTSLNQVLNQVHQTNGIVLPKLGFFGKISKDVAQEFTKLYTHVEEMLDQVPPEQTETGKFHSEQVVIPYIKEVCASKKAIIDLQTANGAISPSEKFALALTADSINATDLENVVESYQNQVQAFFALQKELITTPIEQIHCSNEDEYKRVCEKVTYEMDALASALFKTKISTPAHIDIKEKSPHQFLQKINVGFEPTLIKLQNYILHEGSIGHNTHDQLSMYSDMRDRKRHGQEGLAILGQLIGTQQLYSKHEKGNELTQYMMVDRGVTDALGAAFEYLLFGKEASEQEVLSQLESEFMSKEEIRQAIKPAINNRAVQFSCGAAHYFVGSKRLKAAYSKMKEAINQASEEHREMLFTKGINMLYTGHRSANIIDAQVEGFAKYTCQGK